jgi:hypothetical protein
MWYYSKNGMQLGPVSQEELSAKVETGEVLAQDLIWREGLTDWQPLSQVAEFSQAIRPAGSPTPPPVQASMGSVPMPQPPAYPAGYTQPKIPNYLWQSIVVTVMCCLPFGVIAIVQAAKVDSLVAQGDIAGATAASRSAKNWVTASVASWLVIVGLYVVFAIIVGVSGAASGSP